MPIIDVHSCLDAMDASDVPNALYIAERSLQQGKGQDAGALASSALRPGATAGDVCRALYVLLQSDYMAGR